MFINWEGWNYCQMKKSVSGGNGLGGSVFSLHLPLPRSHTCSHTQQPLMALINKASVPRFVSDQTLTAAKKKRQFWGSHLVSHWRKRNKHRITNCRVVHIFTLAIKEQLMSKYSGELLQEASSVFCISLNWFNVKVNQLTVLQWRTKTCFQIYMHSMPRVSLLARPSAHAETFCYKSVWMSAVKLPLGAFWLQLCPPGTHYVAKFYDCWFCRKKMAGR